MAVSTPVSKDDARALLEHYSLGSLCRLQGISAGIENTNYFLDTTQGRYVLTLFEVLTHEQLPFYIELMHYLARQGVPVPEPQRLNDGRLFTTLNGKPCAIVSRLAGQSVMAPTTLHCRLSGEVLADIHLRGRDFAHHQPNLRGLSWWRSTIPQVVQFVSPAQKQLLDTALNEQIQLSQQPDYALLPSGPAHCDCFRDNVLFDGTADQPTMGGVIDFYFAGCDHWLFDVAVTVNDWCIDHQNGQFDPALLAAWLGAYHAKRPFTEVEHKLWPAMLRAAALRFWVSRLYDYYCPRDAQILTPHDPTHFEMILKQRLHNPIPALGDFVD